MTSNAVALERTTAPPTVAPLPCGLARPGTAHVKPAEVAQMKSGRARVGRQQLLCAIDAGEYERWAMPARFAPRMSVSRRSPTKSGFFAPNRADASRRSASRACRPRAGSGRRRCAPPRRACRFRGDPPGDRILPVPVRRDPRDPGFAASGPRAFSAKAASARSVQRCRARTPGRPRRAVVRRAGDAVTALLEFRRGPRPRRRGPRPGRPDRRADARPPADGSRLRAP